MTAQRLSKTFLYFFILVLVFWSRELFFGVVNITSNDNIGFTHIGNLINNAELSHYILRSILIIFMIAVNGFFITRISIRFFHFINKFYTPAILYLAIVSSCESLYTNLTAQIVTYFILYSIERQQLLLFDYKSIHNSYYSGFFIGLAALLFPIASFLYLTVFIAIIVYNSLKIKASCVSLIGLSTPIFLYSYFNWVAGGEFTGTWKEMLSIIDVTFMRMSINFYDYNFREYLYSLFVFAQAITGIILHVIWTIKTNSKQSYTYYQFIWISGVILIIGILFFISISSLLPIIFIPITLIFSVLIIHIKNTYIKASLITANILFPIALIYAN